MFAPLVSVLKLARWLFIDSLLLAVLLPVAALVLYILFFALGFIFGHLFVALVWVLWALSPAPLRRRIEWWCNRDAIIAEQRRAWARRVKAECREDRKKMRKEDIRAMREIAAFNSYRREVRAELLMDVLNREAQS